MEGLKRRKLTFGAVVRGSLLKLSRFSYSNKLVSFIVFTAGAIFVTSLFPGDFTPTAAQRVQWRQEKVREEQDQARKLQSEK